MNKEMESDANEIEKKIEELTRLYHLMNDKYILNPDCYTPLRTEQNKGSIIDRLIVTRQMLIRGDMLRKE